MASVLRAARKMPSPLGRWLESTYARIPFAWRYGPVYRRTYRFLAKSQWWSAEELREYQRRRLRRLLRHAYENVPYYRGVFDERGLKPDDFDDVEDLKKLPILTKDIIREHRDDLTARNIPRRNVPGTIEGLRERNILVRDRSSLEQLEGYIRVSIGFPEQMKRFLDAMTAIFAHRKDFAFSNK